MASASAMRELLLTRIVPIGLVVGAGMETFMYFTGFWSVATRKEAERRHERAIAESARPPQSWR